MRRIADQLPRTPRTLSLPASGEIRSLLAQPPIAPRSLFRYSASSFGPPAFIVEPSYV
jgi:hypothetical protein